MKRPEVKAVALLAGISILPRLYQLNSEFVTREDWGLAQLAVYVRNYIDLGFLETQFLPVFGVVGGENVTYTNHPFLTELLNALWCMVFGMSEGSMRSFAIVWSLLTVLVLYRLGRQLWDHTAGLLAAGFYAFTPMSIYLGRTPNIESSCFFFSLLGVSLAIDWDEQGQNWQLAGACLAMVLGAWCDHFTIFLIPYLFLIAAYRRSWGLLLVSAAPGLGYACYLGYIAATAGLGDLMYGASKYASPWTYWLQPSYYWVVFKRVMWNYGGLPPLLAIWGSVQLGREAWSGQKEAQRALLWLFPILGLFFTDLVLSPGVILVHVFRIVFIAAPLALLAAYAVRPLTTAPRAAVLVLCLLLSGPPLKELFTVTNGGDIPMARFIREHTTDNDLLLGLPPHMAYYVDRKAVVSYAYTWVGEGVFKTPEDAFARLRPFAEHREYERLVLFTQFLLNPRTSLKGVDFSQTFENLPGWERVTTPEQEPQVWKRVEPEADK